jgi:hypothetical protein
LIADEFLLFRNVVPLYIIAEGDDVVDECSIETAGVEAVLDVGCLSKFQGSPFSLAEGTRVHFDNFLQPQPSDSTKESESETRVMR